MKKTLFALLFTVALLLNAAAADEKGWFGFGVDVKTSGFMLNPNVASIVIAEITPNSPAAAQRVAVGDEIVEAEGTTVPGSKALQLRSIMTKRPGETLHLRLKRKDGEIYSATITATKRPG
jgi:S1-C subfamily serine protease